jgi:hypothetical protein
MTRGKNYLLNSSQSQLGTSGLHLLSQAIQEAEMESYDLHPIASAHFTKEKAKT